MCEKVFKTIIDNKLIPIYCAICVRSPNPGPLEHERQRLQGVIESLWPAVTSRTSGALFQALRDFTMCGSFTEEVDELYLCMCELELLAFTSALFRQVPDMFGAGAVYGETRLVVKTNERHMTFDVDNRSICITFSTLGFAARTGVDPEPESEVASGEWAVVFTTFPSMRALLTHFDFFGCPEFAAEIAAIASDLGAGRLFREDGECVTEVSVETHQCNLFGFAPCPKCACSMFCAISQRCGMCYD